MTILLYKNGQLLIDGEQPLEGVSLDNLAAILSSPKEGDVVKYDEESGMWIVGEAGTYSKPSGGIPETDLAQAVKDKLNKFVVTLTPTSPDFSGTMDKTVSEINAAYEAGKQIVFRIYGSPTLYYDINVTLSSKAASDDVPIFVGYGVLTEQFIVFETYTAGNYYATSIYNLTPAS